MNTFRRLMPAFLVMLSLQLFSQNDFYVAAKNGLSVRKDPGATASVLDKIPYGTKVTLLEDNNEWAEATGDGLKGNWRKVKYNNKMVYISSIYLFPFPPPKATVKDMTSYLAQLAVPFGSKLVVKSPARPDDDMTWELHKQLYKNGAEWHRFIGYEYDSDTYFLPEFTLEQAFLLVRLLPQFKDVFGEKDEYPSETRTFKKGEHEYKVTVEKETYEGGFSWTRRIRVEYEDGVMYSFEMYQIDNQIVITFGAGV